MLPPHCYATNNSCPFISQLSCPRVTKVAGTPLSVDQANIAEEDYIISDSTLCAMSPALYYFQFVGLSGPAAEKIRTRGRRPKYEKSELPYFGPPGSRCSICSLSGPSTYRMSTAVRSALGGLTFSGRPTSHDHCNEAQC